MMKQLLNWHGPLSIMQRLRAGASAGIYALSMILMVGIGMSVTSCKDDDNNKSEEEKAKEAKQAEDVFWDVVGQLTSIENYTEDYKDKTFEASIGQPSSNNPLVRIVSTGDMATAALRFGNLIGNKSINENTTSFEWKNDAVGTLSYTKTTDGSSLATVDVNIKQLPGLQKIIYCTPEQMGENGEFRGNAWYRFGDVISREYQDKNDNNKKITDYWVCVRAACGPAGKETTHWISLSPLPKNNRFEHNGSNGAHYAVPKGIGTNTEHMQNFAELMYAILYPHEWGKNLTSNERLPHPKMWHDFKPERYDYNNEYFFERVYRHWIDPELDIFGKVFGMTELQFREKFDTYGLNLLVKGYSWWTKFSWNLTLYEYNYSNGTGAEANMHKETYRTIEKDVQNIKDLDLTGQYAMNHNYLVSEAFFGNACPRYTIRHATGKDLCGATPNAHNSLAGTKDGVTIKDVYCYNKLNDIPVNDYGDPDITPAFSTLSAPVVGCIIGKDGKFYPDIQSAKEYGSEGIAMVTYLGGDKRVEKGSSYNGLAIALSNATLEEGNTAAETTYWSSTNTRNVFCTSQVTNPQEYANVLDGILYTQKLRDSSCGEGHDHPAAKLLNNWKTDYVANLPEGYSKWFVPSIGQWVLTLQGVGETQNGNSFTSNQKLDDLLKNAGLENVDLRSIYFTTTEKDFNNVFCIEISKDIETSVYKTEIKTCGKKEKECRVRPMLAFKYGNGGTQDPAAVNPVITSYPVELGYVLTSDGKFFPTKAKAEAADQDPIGIVAYINEDGVIDNSDASYKGLAISTEFFKDVPWGHEAEKNDNYTTVASTLEKALKVFDGIKQTEHLIELETEMNLKFDAAKKCWTKPYIVKASEVNNFSKWFLPSVGQWALVFRGMGYGNWDIQNNTGENMTKSFKKLFTDAGFPEPGNGIFWTSTTKSKGVAWVWGTNINFNTNFQIDNTMLQVVPFMAFKIKND